MMMCACGKVFEVVFEIHMYNTRICIILYLKYNEFVFVIVFEWIKSICIILYLKYISLYLTPSLNWWLSQFWPLINEYSTCHLYHNTRVRMTSVCTFRYYYLKMKTIAFSKSHPRKWILAEQLSKNFPLDYWFAQNWWSK